VAFELVGWNGLSFSLYPAPLFFFEGATGGDSPPELTFPLKQGGITQRGRGGDTPTRPPGMTSTQRYNETRRKVEYTHTQTLRHAITPRVEEGEVDVRGCADNPQT
jgi:hypothetical protein